MKCVCPMGGDRTCPDDCLLAVWANLPADDRKARRKSIAEQLYKQNFTMEQIATQLGAAINTIHHDLKSFSTIEKPPRPKGGRPKGSKRTGPQPQRRTVPPDIDRAAAMLVLDQGKTYDQVKTDLGLRSINTVKQAVAREEGRREPLVDRAALSMSAQQKFDAAIRQEKARLGATFLQALNNKMRKQMDEILLPDLKKRMEHAEKLFSRRRGIMNKEAFNNIRRCLHPDSRHSLSDQKLAQAFDLFNSYEKDLLSEKESPTTWPTLPKDLAEWDRQKAKVKAERAAKRAARAGGQMTRGRT